MEHVMDVETGNFQFDFKTGQVKSSVARNGSLSPEIAGEGQKVLLSDGSVVSFNPAANKPIVPDWSEIKSIKHYFNRTDFYAWPAWFYHPSEAPIIIKGPEEAWEKYQIRRRESTMDERARTSCGPYVWDWPEECKWRPTPYHKEKFDPRNPGYGKNYVPEKFDPALAQSAAIRDLVEALKGGGEYPRSGLSPIDPALAAEFAAFQAWREANREAEQPLKAIDPDRVEWEEAARRVGVRPDGRWSLEKLKAKVQEAAKESALCDPVPQPEQTA
jgi:hypothetical protein